MTHISNDLNRLCRNWCPIVDQCPIGQYCVRMNMVRRQLMKISEFKTEEEIENEED